MVILFHLLGTLVRQLKLPTTGEYHRALADAEMTASLIIKIKYDIQKKYNLSSVPHEMVVSQSLAQARECLPRGKTILLKP